MGLKNIYEIAGIRPKIIEIEINTTEEKNPLPSSMFKMKRSVKVIVMVLTKMHDSVRITRDRR